MQYKHRHVEIPEITVKFVKNMLISIFISFYKWQSHKNISDASNNHFNDGLDVDY